jgi:hypothetical protein
MRGLTKLTLLLAALMLMTASSAMANGVTLGTETLSFQDGSTITGYFTLNTANNTLTSWDFTTTAGTLFSAETFSSADTANAPSSLVASNFNGDEVLTFEENQADMTRQELDIAISCGGVTNCLTNANLTTPQSFALTVGSTPCPPPGTAGLCIVSGLQHVPEGFGQELLAPGFLNLSDPPGQVAFNISNSAANTVFTGTGGTGNNTVPEPSTLLLSALGFAAFALKRSWA